jgi:heat shock protein HtpX
MTYVGLDKQVRSNNFKSSLLLAGFPLLILTGAFAVTYVFSINEEGNPDIDYALSMFIQTIPFVLGGVAIWFLIAFWGHSKMIDFATGSHTLERKENMRVYNLTENLCMSVGMPMPKLKIIESPALNAFASGLTEKNYSVTLTRGIINHLNDEELEGVIAHELMHIRNKDVRLLVITIIFVGIFSLIVSLTFRTFLHSLFAGNRSRKDDGKGGGAAILVILLVAVVIYFLSIIFKFALSRKREYMADAGAAQMTRNPMALASALRKISGNHHVDVRNDEVQEMFIENRPDDNSMGFLGGIGNLFSTHPPIQKRIQILEQF